MRKVNAIPAVVMLTAGMITCLISIKKRYAALDTLVILLAVLVLFYILGIIARSIIFNIVKKVEEEEAERLRQEELLKQQQEEQEKLEKAEREKAERLGEIPEEADESVYMENEETEY